MTALLPCVHVLDVDCKRTFPLHMQEALKPCIKDAAGTAVVSQLQSSRDVLVFQRSHHDDDVVWPNATLDIPEFIQQVIGYASVLNGFINGKATDTSNTSYSSLLSFCEWTDLLTASTVFALDARQEMAQTLMATGITLMHVAQQASDTVMEAREVDVDKLKKSYQALLNAAGAFDAATVALGYATTTVGESSQSTEQVGKKEGAMDKEDETPFSPTAEEMDAWRSEQVAEKTQVPTTVEATEEVVVNIPPVEKEKMAADLQTALFSKLLSCLSLAMAQEMVVYRAASSEFTPTDMLLMANLSLDLFNRYSFCKKMCADLLNASSKIQLEFFCSYKSQYYIALVDYFEVLENFKKTIQYYNIIRE